MRFVSSIAIAAVAGGCRGTPVESPSLAIADLPTTVSLSVGELRRVGGVAIRFSAVRGDSRCPSDVVCVWEGNAELEFVVGPASGDEPASRLELNTSSDPRTGSALGLALTVEDLAPIPVSTKPTKEYRVRLRIEVAGK